MAKIKLLLVGMLFCVLVSTGHAQTTITPANAPASSQVIGRSDFHKGVVKAVGAAVRKGELSRSASIRIRVAMLSPAFRKHAEDLAVIQMAFSGDDVPVNDDGTLNRAGINWEELIIFLEKLLPLILKLLEFIGGMS